MVQSMAIRLFRLIMISLASLSIGKIKGLLREPRFITEKRKINDLFQVMQKEKIQMVIVIDEYGQTAGLVVIWSMVSS